MKQGTGRKKHKKQAGPKNLPCQKNDRAVITIEDIDAVVTPRLEERVFDLTNAIAEKKRKKEIRNSVKAEKK